MGVSNKYARQELNLISERRKERDYSSWVILLFFAAFGFRILMAGISLGHVSDLNCFIHWADRIVETGWSEFYSDKVFTDYPPGYMYILSILGWIRKWFSLENYSFANLILMKFPGILCDMGTGYFIYKIVPKKEKRFAFFATLLYLMNPAIFLNSSVWGQVDSIFTLCVVVTCYLVMKGKLSLSYFVFALGILIKPQTLIFTPVVLYGLWDKISYHKDKEKRRREFSIQSIWAFLSILFLFMGMIPFGLDTVIKQYGATMTSYPYATINAYNIWNVFGLNWCPQTGSFLGIEYSKWGTMGIVSTVFLSMYFWQMGKEKKEKYFICGALIISGMFLLSVRMHERYLYPVLVLLLAAYIIGKEIKWLISYLLFSAGHFLNVFLILYQEEETIGFQIMPCILSLFLIGSFGYFIYQILFLWKRKVSRQLPKEKGSEERRELGEKGIKKRKETEEKATGGEDGKLYKNDFLIMAILTFVYAFLAFYNLGDRKAPVSFYEVKEEGDSVVLDFGVSTYITELYFFLGNQEDRQFILEVSDNAEGPYYYVTDVFMERVFAWNGIRINEKGQYWRLISKNGNGVIGELVFYDFDGKLTTPVDSIVSGEKLFDEQEIFQGRSTFRNSTYFDEIYHARTAFEYLNGLYSYENTHPPLGKIWIALGMKIFGVNPFGWRFMGTLFGVLMVSLLYIFGKRIAKSTFLATMITLLFTFDFMHFVQTRLATIDVFVTFFILLMYYFMYRYLESNCKKWLAFSGIAMGFGVASKWTGIYAGVGLGILFFHNLWNQRKQKKQKEEYLKELIHLGLFCILFFIIIPLGIYTLSYLPFSDGSENGLIKQMLSNQVNMFSYHWDIEAEHPFSSWWYQWPTIFRPIWYYSGTTFEGLKEGISSFGNPLVWWTGIPAFLFCTYLAGKKKDTGAFFLVIAYLAQYLPWFFVTRITFIYHYFPSIPFVVLMIGQSMKELWKPGDKTGKTMILLYTSLTVGAFILFYPVLSGMGVSENYVEYFLRWFDSWVLI